QISASFSTCDFIENVDENVILCTLLHKLRLRQRFTRQVGFRLSLINMVWNPIHYFQLNRLRRCRKSLCCCKVRDAQPSPEESFSLVEKMSLENEKDNVFWKTLLEHKVPKKKLKKKNTKLSNAKELALKYHVSKEDVEKIYKIFVSMDDDGSGTITANEIAQMLCGFGCDVSPKVVQAVMRSSDKSGDGEIDFEEFLTAITSKIKLNNCKAEIQAMFNKFDRDKDGLLSAEELVVAWSETLKTKITVKEAAALIQQADSEGKGAVTVNEFITMCQTV
ncbi:unnamed protein product, partial [Cylicocyclus nassatus]